MYLKASNPRFPKKYQAAWDDEREQFQQALTGIPMSTVVEQVQALSDHYEKLVEARDVAEDPKDVMALSNAIVKTVAGLYTMTRDPVYQNQLNALKAEKGLAIGASAHQAIVAPSEAIGALEAPDARVLTPSNKEKSMALAAPENTGEEEEEPVDA